MGEPMSLSAPLSDDAHPEEHGLPRLKLQPKQGPQPKLYVSVNANQVGTGQVVRIDP